MPSIKITDGLGLTIDADLAPLASLVKYVREVPSALLEGGDIRQLQLLTLNDPAARALRPTLWLKTCSPGRRPGATQGPKRALRSR
jgi:hypothetical protein